MVREREGKGGATFTRGRKRKGSRETDSCLGVWSTRASEEDDARLDEERRLAIERERSDEAVTGGQGRIRLAREKEGSSRRESDGDIVEAHVHMHRASTHSPADAHRAVKLAHYRLPDSHHGLLEKSIEYKKSPWCARRAEPSPLPPSSFPSFSLSLSSSFVLFLSLSLSVTAYLFLYLSSAFPFAHHPPCYSPHLSRAHAISVFVTVRDEERESSRVYSGDRRR